MDSSYELMLLEQTRIFPASSGIRQQIISLSFLDISWIAIHPVHQLCFYDYPHSKSHFTQTTIPKLKNSLSITLKHFFPYAGNLNVFPYDDDAKSTTRKIPEIHFNDGDSVSLVIAESTNEFNELVGNHPRKADHFYPLVPQLGKIVKTADQNTRVPLLAIQVTLFPGQGICIGLTTHHIACDGNARVQFLKAWASITRSGDDSNFISNESPPVFDRTVLKDPKGLRDKFWSFIMTKNIESQPPHLFGPTDKFRVTFYVTRTEINGLKRFVLAKRQSLTYVSSFVIVSAHVWRSLARLHATTMEDTDLENIKLQRLNIPIDGRSRLDPPIPATYFGNCLVGTSVTAKRAELTGEEGFPNAVEIIQDAIRKRLRSQESLFEDSDNWFMKRAPAKVHGIAGSPKFNVYDSDFGFGKPRKCEAVSIDYKGTLSLFVSRECEDDMEIGFSLSHNEINVFAAIFEDGLKTGL